MARSLATMPLEHDAVVVINPREDDPINYELPQGTVPVEVAARYFSRAGSGIEGLRFDPYPHGPQESPKGTTTKEMFVARYLRGGQPEAQSVEITVRLKKPKHAKKR